MNIIYRFIYFFIIVLLISCNSTSSLTGIDTTNVKSETKISNTVMQRVHFIDSYISAIDFKAKDYNNLNVNQLKIKGDKRIITSNESEKNIVLKNKSIVRVKYKDHLHNNFIKSKIFYYNKNELVCIKIQEILPNQLNKSTLYKRTIYLQNNKPISDSDISNSTTPSNDLVNLGLEQLKNEYISLN